MTRPHAGRLAVTLATLAFALSACSAGTAPDGDAEVTLVGVVTELVDQVPVDGGVTIRIAVEGGRTETLLFGSLFTMPPPSSQRWAVYQAIQRAEVGSRVRATGIRVEGGLDLRDFRVLE